MNDEEQKWWQQERQRLAKSARWFDFHQAYSALVWEACAYASLPTVPKKLERWPMEKLAENIDSWFDDLRDKDVPLGSFTLAKQHLLWAFNALAINQAQHVHPGAVQCPVCHGELTTAFNEPMVCENCMRPVLNALDDLVRATTTEWTPEQFRELAGSYFEV